MTESEILQTSLFSLEDDSAGISAGDSEFCHCSWSGAVLGCFSMNTAFAASCEASIEFVSSLQHEEEALSLIHI